MKQDCQGSAFKRFERGKGMARNRNKDFKNNLNQAIHNSTNPWEMQQNIQRQLQSEGVNNTQPVKREKANSKKIDMPEYDMSKLMDNLGSKMPPGVKQMMEQFMTIIPGPGAMDNPNFKKEMKKKMKGLSSAFKSPYE